MTVLLSSRAWETAGRAVAVETSRLDKAKRAFTTRNVCVQGTGRWLCQEATPRSGDLVLARVTEVGQHRRLERTDGRRASLFVEDEVVVTYGARYAPDQFESTIPTNLAPCHLVAAGGIAGTVASAHAAMQEPTALQPLGLLADDEGVMSLGRCASVTPGALRYGARPPTFVVAGTSMNAGKSTVVASLVRGLSRAGLSVGTAKVTGTGAGGDLWLAADAGARWTLDFTDAGYATTFGVPVRELTGVFGGLTRRLSELGAEVIVVEVADGLFQGDTAGLLGTAELRDALDGVFFAAADALGARSGVEWLRGHGYPVVAAGGLMTASPLAAREATQALRPFDVPVVDSEGLATRMGVTDVGSLWSRLAGAGVGRAPVASNTSAAVRRNADVA